MKLRFFIPLFFLCSCSGNKFIEYYEPVTSVSGHVFSKKKPAVIETTRDAERIKSFTDKGYIVIGQAVFQGKWEPRYLAVKAARQNGADVVVITSKQTDERTKNAIVPVVQPNVSFSSGNVGRQSFQGTSVGVSTGHVNLQYVEKIYKQKAYFLKQVEEKK